MSLRYAQVWEDVRVLRAALRIAPGERVLSIAGAGDNALALLLDDPAVVVAVDYDAAALALLRLKVAAVMALDGPALRAFLGAAPSSSRARLACYRRLAPSLSGGARAYFDERPREIARGVIHAGKLERYFNLFRRVALPLVQARSTVRAYLAATTLEEQRELFRSAWDNARWRLLFRIFFSRAVLARFGRDASLFEHVEERDVAAAFLARLQRAFVTLPARDNYVAEYLMTGRYSGHHGLPAYLDDDSLPLLRARLARLSIVEGELGAVLDEQRGFDAFNLSDVFEWMDEPAATLLYRRVLAAANPRARLAYWNLLVPRACPPSLAHLVEGDDELARALFAVDRNFFYGRFVVERVREGARQSWPNMTTPLTAPSLNVHERACASPSPSQAP